MSLSHFRQTRSAYHPGFGEYSVGDKSPQLRFLIWCINQSAAKTFDFGPNLDFDEAVIATRIQF